MQIRRGMNGETILYFPGNELKAVLAILRAMYTVTKLPFILECIEDMEVELRPKITLVVHNHLCSECCMMVDDKSENSLRIERDGDITWRHKQCQELKKNRP